MQHLRCFHAYKQSILHGEVCSWLLLAELTAALPQSTCGGLHHSEKHCSCLQIISPSAALQPGRFIYNKNQLLKASLPPHFYRTVIPIPGSGALLQACNKQQERRRRSPARWAQNTLCQHPKEALTLLSVPAGAAHSILLPANPAAPRARHTGVWGLLGKPSARSRTQLWLILLLWSPRFQVCVGGDSDQLCIMGSLWSVHIRSELWPSLLNVLHHPGFGKGSTWMVPCAGAELTAAQQCCTNSSTYELTVFLSVPRHEAHPSLFCLPLWDESLQHPSGSGCHLHWPPPCTPHSELWQVAMSVHKGTQAALTGMVALVILRHQTLQIPDELSQASAGHNPTPQVTEAAKIVWNIFTTNEPRRQSHFYIFPSSWGSFTTLPCRQNAVTWFLWLILWKSVHCVVQVVMSTPQGAAAERPLLQRGENHSHATKQDFGKEEFAFSFTSCISNWMLLFLGGVCSHVANWEPLYSPGACSKQCLHVLSGCSVRSLFVLFLSGMRAHLWHFVYRAVSAQYLLQCLSSNLGQVQ